MRVYSSEHKASKWSRRVRFNDCPRFLRYRLFPGWTKADHVKAAQHWQAACDRAAAKATALRAAADAEHGGGSPFGPYLEGGTRPHWPQPVRLRILRLAIGESECRGRATAHRQAGDYLRTF